MLQQLSPSPRIDYPAAATITGDRYVMRKKEIDFPNTHSQTSTATLMKLKVGEKKCFLKDHAGLGTGEMAVEISAVTSQKN